jgi:hypothetical protein
MLHWQVRGEPFMAFVPQTGHVFVGTGGAPTLVALDGDGRRRHTHTFK